jgi:hypothetical protein
MGRNANKIERDSLIQMLSSDLGLVYKTTRDSSMSDMSETNQRLLPDRVMPVSSQLQEVWKIKCSRWTRFGLSAFVNIPI